MKEFAIYTSPSFGARGVKRNFRWGCVAFGWPWGIHVRLWWFVIIQIILSSLAIVTFGMTLLVVLTLNIVGGFKGSRWEEQSYVKKGYKFEGTVLAPNRKAAEMKFAREAKSAREAEFAKDAELAEKPELAEKAELADKEST